ncbi:50S ribosomal protein L4 [Membranihabitans maritimus]|uniref:50S ribosomal protein L4 n=1 Tax=Membranihabitans maritimus TaxID=2904244 RepID=UPI001F02CC6C|nr:50S ribosomal protein L4 [Membranihabitans maritimus]
MKIDIVNTNGESLGRSIELPSDVFGVEPNEHAVYLAVKHYLKNQRQGTHKAKERSEVAGSTRKIKRQKGTGTARFGDIKNPIFRGGGRIFGPRPRSYNSKLNSKLKVVARNSALSSKAQNGKVSVVEDFTLEQPSTKSFMEIISNLKLNGEKVLMVTGDYDKNLYLSGRNNQKVRVVESRNLNTYEIMNAGVLLFAESAIQGISSAENN